VQRLSSAIVDTIATQGWLSGIPLGVESPGLMTGLAGIGYALLRLAVPTRVPSVLVLEAPKTA
jgi:lantibiotic modifying enzyme